MVSGQRIANNKLQNKSNGVKQRKGKTVELFQAALRKRRMVCKVLRSIEFGGLIWNVRSVRVQIGFRPMVYIQVIERVLVKRKETCQNIRTRNYFPNYSMSFCSVWC